MSSSRHDKPVESDLLSAGEAARELGVAVETLRRWEREGKLSPIRTLGGHRRFPRAEVDAMRTARSAS